MIGVIHNFPLSVVVVFFNQFFNVNGICVCCYLQATTAEHGLTEYWAHRVTWCAAPASYPRIFAWVYRHEGRRLKVRPIYILHANCTAESRSSGRLTNPFIILFFVL